MENTEKMKSQKIKSGFQTAAIIILTLLAAYGLANLEVIRRARAASGGSLNGFSLVTGGWPGG